MIKWEYKTKLIGSMKASDLEKVLNEFGKDGWHLIQLHSQATTFMAVFTREVKENPSKNV
jgi:hypothetical protein